MLTLEAVVTLEQEVEQAWRTLLCASPISCDGPNSEPKTPMFTFSTGTLP